jgi:HisJ family histidinol phosphate phosphatase
MLDISEDGHVHTNLCHHALGAMEDYVQAAIDRGLRKIIFLEHLEAGIEYFESTLLTDRLRLDITPMARMSFFKDWPVIPGTE